MNDNHDNGAVPPSTDVTKERLRNPQKSLHHKTSELLKVRGILPNDFSESSNVSPESLADITFPRDVFLGEFGGDRSAAQRLLKNVERLMGYPERGIKISVPLIDIMYRAAEIYRTRADVTTNPQAIKIALEIQTVPVQSNTLERVSDDVEELRREIKQLRQLLTDIDMTGTHLFKGMREMMERLEELRDLGMDISKVVRPHPDGDRGA